MKIAFPVNNDKATICDSFGRAGLFAFADTESGETSFVENKAMNAGGGAGVKAAQLILDRAADAVITPRCGGNAANIFKAAKVKLLRAEGASLADNIEAFKAGRLQELAEFHTGRHGHGHNG